MTKHYIHIKEALQTLLSHSFLTIGTGLKVVLALSWMVLFTGCARMGAPDGGWYDETPPHVVKCSPADQSINVKAKKVVISFDEVIKLQNATEKVVVSPPQLEAPEIKAQGSRIVVELKDTLKENTTYTIDFSDAISDNNEGNPLGNYTYSFSTGEQIDTMEVSGYVLAAENLEPVKGILVGLYDDLADSAFVTKPLLRVSRTNSEGHFVIKGIANGNYRVYAVQDMDGNYAFTQKSEAIGFLSDIITPTSMPDIRQDTIWSDSLHIKNIDRVGYTHFLPDDIVLKAFTERLTDRYLLKSERSTGNKFTLFFSTGDGTLPTIKGLDFDERDAFLIEATPKADTITYWLRDTMLVNRDTLNLSLTYLATDTLGNLYNQTDTMQMLSRTTYAKRMKDKEKKYEQWRKKQERKRKHGEPYDSIMPPDIMEAKIEMPNKLQPDKNIGITFETPVQTVDTAKIHIYARQDTVWYPIRLKVSERERKEYIDSNLIVRTPSTYRLIKGEWTPGTEYSLEVDSAAFIDIYGHATKPMKQGFRVGENSDYASFFVDISGYNGRDVIVQLLDGKDNVVKETRTHTGTAEFFYLDPKTYYMRMIVDSNGNGQWDTGNYSLQQQAEEVFYFPKKMEFRANWDIRETWNPSAVVANKQKPYEIQKQKVEQKRKVTNRNARRAMEKGIAPPSK